MSPDEAAQAAADSEQAQASNTDYQGPDKNEDVLGLSQWLRDQNDSGSQNDSSQDEESGDYPGMMPGSWFTPKKGPKKKKPTLDNSESTDTPDTKTDEEPETAEDGQSLSQQTPWTQTSFQAQYGLRAAKEWVKQHNTELAKNRQVYGVSEPTAGQKSLSGTETAPNRTIGAVAPPYAAPQSVIPTTAPDSVKPLSPTDESGTTPVIATPSGTPTTLPGTTKPIQNADGTVTTERSITITDPRINGGKPTNIPTVWGGQIVSDEQAIKNAVQSRTLYPSYPTIDAAVSAAKQRSNDLGAGKITSVGGASGVGGTEPPPQPTDLVTVTDQWGNVTIQSKADLDKRPGGTADLTITPYVSPAEKQSAASSDQYMNQVMRGGQPDTHEPPSQWVLALPDQGEAKPIEYLAQLHLRGQGQPVQAAGQESERVLDGISGLLHGDKNSAWAEAYLNDVARLAWVKENAASGTRVDPRNAPEDYISKWKDAFYGSDNNVPFVQDLDQQMLDRASKTSTPEKFNWQVAFGQTGEGGLISRQVASNDCGPNAFATLLRSRGYNADPATTLKFAEDTGFHNGEQFTGAYNMSRMLREEAGLDSQTSAVDWKVIDKELAEGRPVALSSGGHYWVVASKRDGPNGAEYYTGATGAVVGNPEWSRPDQIHYNGAPDYMITAKGDVDPNSRAVRDMGLRPAGTTPEARRENLNMLSDQQRPQTQANSYDDPGTYTPLRNIENIEATDTYKPIINRAANTYKVDPDLIEAIMYAESRGNPDAQSGKGAGGLMQITEPTARGLGIEDRFDPEQNIMGGAKYIGQLIEQFGDVETALAAYNAGPGNVMKYGGIPPFEETQVYVPRVMDRYRALQAARQAATPIPVRARVTR
jgi:soluble lytic murein transglycosylase-like protein